MVVVGILIRKFDGRYLIMFGFLLLGVSTYMFVGINLEIAQTNIIYPMIASGCAMGFVFVPLTTLAMGTLSNQQMGNASGIYNLMRNTGGSFGIAAMTSFLARGAQTHQAALAPNLSEYNPAFQDLVARVQQNLGSGATVEQAYGVIYSMTVKQAAVLAYIDDFRLLAFLCILCVPAALLFKRVKGAKPPPGAH